MQLLGPIYSAPAAQATTKKSNEKTSDDHTIGHSRRSNGRARMWFQWRPSRLCYGLNDTLRVRWEVVWKSAVAEIN